MQQSQTKQTALSLLRDDDETRRFTAVETSDAPPPLPPEPPAKEKPELFTVGEALALRREAAAAGLEELLINLCGGWMWEGGEANPRFQQHKIWLKELLFRMTKEGGGISITQTEASNIFDSVID